jgi:lysophospholipase L1-like esterase
MSPLLINLAFLPFLPFIYRQGLHARATVPRLPPASGAISGEVAGNAEPIRLLVAGESTAIGVGVEKSDDALAAQLAREIHSLTGRAVHWRMTGLSGGNVSQAQPMILENARAQPFDLCVLVFGVNDVLDRTAPARFRDALAALGFALRDVSGSGVAPIIITAAPPIHLFPALPLLLRTYLGAYAHALNRAAARTPLARAAHVATPIKFKPELFSSDGFHPSAQGYAVWAAHLARTAQAIKFIPTPSETS